jgi:hypothetical protein
MNKWGVFPSKNNEILCEQFTKNFVSKFKASAAEPLFLKRNFSGPGRREAADTGVDTPRPRNVPQMKRK